MKSIAEIIAELRAQHVHLWADGDAIRFRGPKGILTPELMAFLKANKAALLDALHESDSSFDLSVSVPEPIRPVDFSHPLPLSFAQERMWFLDRIGANTDQLNQFRGFSIEGPLRVDILEKCLEEIERRHSILRTTIHLIEGAPRQVVSLSSGVRLVVSDLQGDQNAAVEVARAIRETAETPFDLENGPLWRVQLLRLGSTRYVFLAAMHHVICDGWSTGVFWRELATLYTSFRQGQPSPLPELPLQYADFATWQRLQAQHEAMKQQTRYWKTQLAGAPPLLELPTDRPRLAGYRYHGRVERFTISLDLTTQLEQLGRRHRATLFMVLHAAFSVLLSRIANSTDIVIGTPIANRTRPELESLIGPFLNTLALRINLSGDPSFVVLLERVRKVALDGYTHQEVPFEQVLQALQPPRDSSYPPLVQVMFNLQNVADQPLSISGLTVTPMETRAHYGQFLSLESKATPDGLKGSFDYNPDLFDASTIRRMADRFHTLLSAIVAHPEARIAELPLLTEAEQRLLVFERNATAKADLEETTVQALFEEQVLLRPDAIAIQYGDAVLTYRELNRRANQLAYQLMGMGVGPGILVGLCVHRSFHLLIGLLGILKAGGAYVALDPFLPKVRQAFLLEDAAVAVLLTQRTLLSQLSPTTMPVLCFDDENGEFPEENPPRCLVVDDLAYVNYTSGSTGRPKGVQIAHRALSNFLNSMREEPGVTSNDVLLAVTTISFDIAALELYLPLITGGTIVLASREVAANGSTLRQLLKTSQATVMQATPATWRMLIAAEWEGDLALKVLCGGEALPRELADQLSSRCGSLWNMYGPTETTIWSAARRIVKEKKEASVGASEPIGSPIANTQLYVLDHHYRLAPLGVGGELYIGGAGLARGYLRRPDLTSEKFIPDPFSPHPGARLYRTGDLARTLPDDAIEFLGRTDHQIKLRGFRIEPGEIEAALESYTGVQLGIVTVREDRPGDKRLVAYVTPQKGAELSASAMRSYLKERLPDYMIPAAFVILEHTPLTPNGKIDRAALPTPEFIASGGERRVVEPQSAVEKVLVDIWRQVLALERIGVDDNFFEIGGHSLLLSEVYVHLQQRLHKEIEMTDLFRYPTVSSLARFLEDPQSLKDTDSKVLHDHVVKQREAIKRHQLVMKRGREAYE